MTSDSYTKAILTLIALALCAMAARDLGWVGSGGDRAAYRLVPVPQARQLLRLEVDTGKTWSANLKRPPYGWSLLEEPPEEVAEPEASAPAPEPEPEEAAAQ